jgi:hypothetical protein
MNDGHTIAGRTTENATNSVFFQFIRTIFFIEFQTKIHFSLFRTPTRIYTRSSLIIRHF